VQRLHVSVSVGDAVGYGVLHVGDCVRLAIVKDRCVRLLTTVLFCSMHFCRQLTCLTIATANDFGMLALSSSALSNYGMGIA